MRNPTIRYCRVNPWCQENLVEATIIDAADIEHAGWFAEGPVEFLEPPNHNEALAGINWDNL